MEHAHDPARVCHYSIAGFIDLLGTKKRIDYIEAGKTPEEQCQRLGEALQNVRKFRDDFEAARRGWLEVETANDVSCPEEVRPLRDSLKGNPIEIHSFSDTVIIHASLATANRKVPLESVWTILVATAAAQLHTLARGIPARGGIEIGLAGDVTSGEIFGPATYRALLLEEKQAD